MTDEQRSFDIREEADGAKHAVAPDMAVTVLPDGESRIFHRNAIKKHMGTGETVHLRALVAELNGVRLYLVGNHLVMTTQDLYL